VAAQVERKVTELGQRLDALRRVHGELESSGSGEQQRRRVAEREEEVRMVYTHAAAIQEGLSAIKRASEAPGPSATARRMLAGAHALLARQFRCVMADLLEEQAAHAQRCRAALERHCRIANPRANEQELASLADALDGEAEPAAFRRPLLGTERRPQVGGGAAADEAQTAERRAEVERLERSIGDLRDLFLSIGALVETQGELLDNIEFSVVSAADATEAAREELRSAKKSKDRVRWRWAKVVLAILVALACIIAPVVLV